MPTAPASPRVQRRRRLSAARSGISVDLQPILDQVAAAIAADPRNHTPIRALRRSQGEREFRRTVLAVTFRELVAAAWGSGPLAAFGPPECSGWAVDVDAVRDACASVPQPLGPEDLGAAYERALMFAIEIGPGGTPRTVDRARGARKATGSYYTPAPLVEHLLDTAVGPLLAEAAKQAGPRRVRAILAFRVCDPACGAGYFLTGALRRIAADLVQARASANLPAASPQEALRDVARTCIFGVDLDPVAAAICRASLAHAAGLDTADAPVLADHVRVGNALLGATPELVARGIPDEALGAVGDPAEVARVRRRNRSERRRPFSGVPSDPRTAFDAWCAAFVAAEPLTERIARVLHVHPRSARPSVVHAIDAAAAEHRFFHWPLEFPEVFARGGFDAVIGNPPFLNQLESATVTARALAPLVRVRAGGAVRGYTDLSATFLALAMTITRPGGRVALVQPQSLLAAKDAAPVRAAALRAGVLESLWVSNEHVFPGASVFTCAPTIRVGPPVPATLARTVGAAFRTLPPTDIDPASLRDEPTWAHLAAAAGGVPDCTLAASGTLAEIADATADFRDQYYGLEGFILEDASLPPADRGDFSRFPAVATSGLIDLAACAWEHEPTRILKRRWHSPRVDREKMLARGSLGPWLAQRLVPKLLLATQTRVLEVFADAAARFVPCTPVITVTPRSPADLWRCAAVLASPAATTTAMRRYAGAALNADAIKLSAKQALTLPLPTRRAAWDLGAAALEHAQHATSAVERRRRLIRFGILMNRAYGLPRGPAREILGWWYGRWRAD